MNKKIQALIMIFLMTFQFSGFLFPTRIWAAANTSAQDALNFLDDTAGKAGLGKIASGKEKTLSIVGNLINILLGFIGILFFIQIFWAGIKWMTSAGNEEVVKEARQIIQNAVIGIVVVFAAFVITNFVLNQIENITGTQTVTPAAESSEAAKFCCRTGTTEYSFRKVDFATDCTGDNPFIMGTMEGCEGL